MTRLYAYIRTVAYLLQTMLLSQTSLINTYRFYSVCDGNSKYCAVFWIFAIIYQAETFALVQILFRLFAVLLLFRKN